MITLGIDLSSQPKDTAASLIEWGEDRILAHDAVLHCDDATLDTLITRADAVGIDAPLGWPIAFTEAVRHWSSPTWDDPTFQKNLRLRLTDRHTHTITRLTPLSVSTDRIALPAMRAMALLTRHGITDRSGTDHPFYEVYPAGSLKRWGLPCTRYKGPPHHATRRRLLDHLRHQHPTLAVSPNYAANDHALDALIASLTARAAATGHTLRPDPHQLPTARREGWIHLPDSNPRTMV